MAERPVFVPLLKGTGFVSDVPVNFTWHRGMAPSQKRKNVAALHEAAASRGLCNLLEISSKSEREIGRRLSAFNLRVRYEGTLLPLESIYQGSKVFEHGGPHTDLYYMQPRDAKRDQRLRESGNLIGFKLEEREFELDPPTSFYDWLYATALFPERDWLRRLDKLDGFTDIEYNPERSVNCQARSCALFVALEQRQLLDDAMISFDRFAQVQGASVI